MQRAIKLFFYLFYIIFIMINFIKSFLAGIFNITPGLSGSILLIMFNLYDKCIYEISNIFKTPKKSILFLLPIGLGITTGIISFSNIIYYLINNYKEETFIVFTGFIFGTIPHLINKSIKKEYKKTYLIPFFIALLLGTIMLLFKENNNTYTLNYNLFSIIKYIEIGILLSISTIIPGISSTILLSIFNLYNIYIISIAKLKIIVLLFILIGFLITTFILSKLINYLLKNYYSYTYFFILGFTISTIPVLFSFNLELYNLLISLFLSFISFIITYYIFKVNNE